MQVIKPFEVNDSNYTSSIAEPDSSQGEAEWSQSAANYFAASSAFEITGTAIINDIVYVSVDHTGGVYSVRSYTKQGEFIDSFSATAGDSITTDGVNLYLSKKLTSTTMQVIAYTKYGTILNAITCTYSQAADENSLAIAYSDGIIYSHSYAAATHSTMTAFYVDSGALASEYAMSVTGAIYGLCQIGGTFYKNDGSTIRELSTDFSSSTFVAFSLLNGQSSKGLFLDDNIFWCSASDGVTDYNIGYIRSDGAGRGLYITGMQAIKTSTHKVYQAAANTTDDPEIGVNLVPPSWVEFGATNKYKSFDYVKSEQSTSTSPLVITLTPNKLFSAIAVFNISGATGVNININDPVAGDVYDVDLDLNDVTGIINMWQYFFYEPALIDTFVIDDLPPYKDATITLTFTGSGDIGVGEIAYGRSRNIGVMVKGTSTDRKSYSTISVDTFGRETVTLRPSATYTSYNVSLPTPNAEYVERTLKDSLDVPTLFIGNDVDGVKLADLGYYERSALVRSNPSRSEINIKVRGLV